MYFSVYLSLCSPSCILSLVAHYSFLDVMHHLYINFFGFNVFSCKILCSALCILNAVHVSSVSAHVSVCVCVCVSDYAARP